MSEHHFKVRLKRGQEQDPSLLSENVRTATLKLPKMLYSAFLSPTNPYSPAPPWETLSLRAGSAERYYLTHHTRLDITFFISQPLKGI